jgi:hypothetical protein
LALERAFAIVVVQRIRMRAVGGVVFLGLLSGWTQDQGLKLTWAIPSTHAAFFDVFDGTRGGRVGEFCLLPCEVDGTIRSNVGSELPWQFVVKPVPEGARIGVPWKVDDVAFRENLGALSPVKVVGHYFAKSPRKIRPTDLLKATPGKEKGDAVECVIIEGRFDLFLQKQTGDPDKAIASLVTVAARRTADGALIAGRYALRGRLEGLPDPAGAAVLAKVEEERELKLREPLQELSQVALKERIDKAVEKGTHWLRSQQRQDGSLSDPKWNAFSGGFGATAFSLLALLHSGIAVSDPVIGKGMGYIGRMRNTPTLTYDLAIKLMAIEAKYLPLRDFEEAVTFSEEAVRKSLSARVAKDDREAASEAVRILLECQGKHGAFGYTREGDTPNFSSLQYCLLGLKSGSRLGSPIPVNVWKRALSALEQAARLEDKESELTFTTSDGVERRTLERPRVWPYYYPRTQVNWETSTMVTAALTCAAIIRSELVRAGAWDDATEQRIAPLEKGALAWLQQHHSMRASLPEGAWAASAMHYYHLYSLERAMMLSRVAKLGDHDWYLEGAALLLSWQRGDGRWESHQGIPLVDTAFALLFLKRATIPVETPSGVASVDARKPSKAPVEGDKR